MTKLDESQIVRIFQGQLNKKFTPEDVECFNIDKTKIVVKIDTLVQSTDMPTQMNLTQATRKSIVACISDFAAKGVKPEYGIISVNLPNTRLQTKVAEIAASLRETSKEFGIKILGGDTNEGKEFVFHVCIFGKTDRIITRRGSRVGDTIFVTGSFGYTAAGLKILFYNIKGGKRFTRKAVNSVLNPKPRLAFGIRCKKYFSSSMDSSDGLSTTLNEMAEQSKHKFIIEKIPANVDLYTFAEKNKIKPHNLVFNGGEEYEFIFTVPKKYVKTVKRCASKLNTPIIEIGHVTIGKGVFIKNDNKTTKLKDLGWRHFK